MDDNVFFDHLRALYEIACRYENASDNLAAARARLEEAIALVPHRLASFDIENKEKFILSKAGERPKKPSKLLPWNHLKKNKVAYEKAVQEYEERRDEAEQEYYRTYDEKRKELQAEDKKERENAISSAEQAVDNAEQEFQIAEGLWQENTLLPEKLKNVHAIGMMIQFIEDERVSTKQDVINLYFEEEYRAEEARKAEEHRRKIEALIQSQNEKIESVASQVADAVSTAEEAMDLAREAIDHADEALSAAHRAGSQED